MVGSSGARMLAITLPHVDAWNAWYRSFGNRVEGYREQRDLVDGACRAVGRDPSEVERTVALLVSMAGGRGRVSGDPSGLEPEAIPGAQDALAPALRAFAAEGVSHVQLVLDPITVESIAALQPTLEALDAS